MECSMKFVCMKLLIYKVFCFLLSPSSGQQKTSLQTWLTQTSLSSLRMTSPACVRRSKSTLDLDFLVNYWRNSKNVSWLVYSFCTVDITKVFDTGSCKLFFITLSKVACPAKLIRIIKKLYTNVHAKLILSELTQLHGYNSGVKQVCHLTTLLYDVLYYLVLPTADNVIEFDLYKLATKTKFKVYNQCRMLLLMYSNET